MCLKEWDIRGSLDRSTEVGGQGQGPQVSLVHLKLGGKQVGTEAGFRLVPESAGLTSLT